MQVRKKISVYKLVRGMKATFDVTVQIDGSNVGVSLSMRDGAEDVELKVLRRLCGKLLQLKTSKIVT